MITLEKLNMANESLETIPLKGKQYAMVKDRVKAFREICPGGSIVTELLQLADGICVFKATIRDEDGELLGTGHAYEKEGSSQVNSTSFLENCETSCIGRALASCGIGLDASYSTADEIAQAVNQQNDKRPATDLEKKIFTDYCKRLSQDPKKILGRVGWTSGKMTVEQHAKALVILKEIEEASEETGA